MSSESNNGGANTLWVLGIVFIVLKLTDVIDWSWWYVTLPLWGGGALVLTIVLIILIVTMINDRL